MYKQLRAAHKWVGLFCALFLMIISATGLGLALKSQFEWIRPATQEGGEIESPEQIVGIAAVMESVAAKPEAMMPDLDSVRRLEYHAGDRIYKLISSDGYMEAQVDAKTGEVLSIGRRNDQFFEDIHDLSIFSDFTADYVLPAVAIGLFGLSCSGVYMFGVPVARRMKFRAKQRREGQDKIAK